MGRPSSYSEEIADRICSEIVAGLSLRRICEADDLPDIRNVMRWLEKSEEFRQQYARARELQAEGYADEIVEIVDTDPDAARARVRADARKWVASKLLPKKYGDRITAEHTGKDGVALIPEETDRSKAALALIGALHAALPKPERS